VIDYGVTLAMKNYQESGPLHLTVRHESTCVAEYLLSLNLSPDLHINHLKQTPLHLAVLHRNYTMIKLFAPLFLNDLDIEGNCALHYADLKAAIVLHEFGCDLNIQNLEGITPLLCHLQLGIGLYLIYTFYRTL
jgi:ankyrin repeat protein